MKKLILVILFVALAVSMSMAQQDVLGAHLVYGRGCVACHAPHSGAAGNGGSNTASPYSGNNALWGQDLSPLYGQTLAFGDNGKYTITLANYGKVAVNGVNPAAPGPADQFGGPFAVIACLSCHDGNIAKPAMMKGTTVEALPNAAGTSAPTFLGADGSTAGNYKNDHPVGPTALVGCGGTYDWDCTIDATGKYTFGGKSANFLTDYFDVTTYGPIAHLVSTKSTSGGWVTCTTCHDQHSMTKAEIGTANAAPTMFFVRGWYDPTQGNSAAQFCRTCHGGESNEMHDVNLATF